MWENEVVSKDFNGELTLRNQRQPKIKNQQNTWLFIFISTYFWFLKVNLPTSFV